MKTAVGFALGVGVLCGCAMSPSYDGSNRDYSTLYQRDEFRDRQVIPYRDDGDYHRLWQDRDRDHGYDD